MPNIVILADDLTGANDTGVQFAKEGFSTVSLLDESDAFTCFPEADVWVINTETRSLSVGKAFDKICSVAKRISISQIPNVYKKIDSTMRGHVQNEIDGLMDCGQFEIAAVVPAYPQNGRITVGGYHMLNGQLIEDSVMAQDPTSPVIESYLPELMGKQTNRRLVHLDIRAVRTSELKEQVLSLAHTGHQILVFDCVSERDLHSITKAVWDTKLRVLWVGSAGLAHFFAKKLKENSGIRHREGTGKDATSPPVLRKNVLVVAGSVCEVTREQVSFLAEKDDFQVLYADPLVFLDAAARNGEITRLAAQLMKAIEKGKHPVLTTELSENTQDALNQWVAKSGQDKWQIGSVIADSLAQIVHEVIRLDSVFGMVLTGGDIAYRTCRALGASGLSIMDEVETGIPLARIIGGAADSLLAVTKSGAFGKRDSLLRAVHAIQTMNRE